MSSTYPSVVATLTYPGPNQTLNAPSHSSVHGATNDEIVQIETFIGTASSVQGTLMYDIRSPNSQGGGHVQGPIFGGTGYTTYTKGDILVASSPSVLTKLAVGADGTVLTARSSAATGIDWEGTTVPTGAMLDFAGSAAPSGYLLCDGSAISRVTNSILFGVIGTTWGIGDGSTTFNVPDSRSRIPMGKGTGTKIATIASISANTFTVTGLTNANNNEYQTGQAIVFNAVVPGNLTNGVTYFVIRVANNQFALATSLANAQNAVVITLLGTETGSFTLTLSARTLADTGGEEKHAMSATEALAHTHAVGNNGGGTNNISISSGVTAGQSGAVFTGSTGGNAAMNVISPFYVVTKIIKT